MPILLETQYLPCIQYFSKFVQYSEVHIEQQEHYLKRTYRNRCYIAAANGPLMLSIPLQKGKNEQLPIKETRISYHENWPRHHWTSIRSAYGNAPYFDYYADGLQAFYQKPYDYLFDFNQALLQWLVEKLQLETTIKVTNEYQHRPEEGLLDWRNGIHPKKHKQREDPHFKAAYYPQAFEDRHGFLSNLSILDLLFCSGPQAPLILEESLELDP